MALHVAALGKVPVYRDAAVKNKTLAVPKIVFAFRLLKISKNSTV